MLFSYLSISCRVASVQLAPNCTAWTLPPHHPLDSASIRLTSPQPNPLDPNAQVPAHVQRPRQLLLRRDVAHRVLRLVCRPWRHRDRVLPDDSQLAVEADLCGQDERLRGGRGGEEGVEVGLFLLVVFLLVGRSGR